MRTSAPAAKTIEIRGPGGALPYLVFQGTSGKACLETIVESEIVESNCLSTGLCEPNRSEPAPSGSWEVKLVPGGRLTQEQAATWRELQDSNSELSNPCFAPEFTQAVAAVRHDVEVAFIGQSGEVVAIFPFQRRGRSRAIPVGGIVSDYQGLICRPGFTCDPAELLKACGLAAWDFDRLLASQSCFTPYHRLCEPSAQIDLSQGYRTYVEERRAAGTSQIHHCNYMIRRLERDLGPVRFVPHSSSPKLLAQVLGWKSEQYQRSGWNDLFATRWGLGLVHRIHSLQSPGLVGMLSLLYAGPQLVAGHLGMRSSTVWHYWFPAYDRAYRKYSPGLVLLLKMAQHAEDLGLSSIDIGTGITLYKRRLMNASVSVAEGSVERSSCLRTLRSTRRRIGSMLKIFSEGVHAK